MPRHQDARGCTVEDTCEVKFATCHINDGVTSDGGFKMSVPPHMQPLCNPHLQTIRSSFLLSCSLILISFYQIPSLLSSSPDYQSPYLPLTYKHFRKRRSSRFSQGDAKNPFSGKTRFDNVFANRDLKSRSIANIMLKLFF